MENSDQEVHEPENEEEIPGFESQLGNVDYWDKFYSQEINQFKNNTDLIGEIWFGEKVQKKILTYIKEYFTNKNIKIIDIGCGNASFLLKLSEMGYKNLYGMDYSIKSIELAQEILNDKKIQNSIILYQEDIKTENESLQHIGFELIHDKGTFDAFMSSKENKFETYLNYINKLRLNYNIHSNNLMTYFILTSCNFSFSELQVMFTQEYSCLKIIESIPHQSFSYGGSTGQVVTTIVFSFII